MHPYAPVQLSPQPVALTGQFYESPLQPCEGKAVTAANGVTLLGYALGLWWVVGGPTWAAVASMLADELDGRLARSMGQASCVGGNLDWAVDLTLTGLVAARLGILWTMPAVTAGQAYLRSREWRPAIGSARAAMMVAALVKGTKPLGKGR
jgi:hypothetical protein